MLIDIFRQTALNHWFERQAARLHREGKIKCPLYLSLGTEHIAPSVLAGLGEKAKEWKWFVQHRCHSIYLSLGGDPLSLFRELLGRKDGCNGGYGGSASVNLPDRMFGHSGLLGDQVPIAVGYAIASRQPTIIVMGDASCEEDYVLGALGHAATTKAPVLFIVEDNGLSIKTKTEDRRSWSIVKVAASFRMCACDDDPLTVSNMLRFGGPGALGKLPALLNIRCCRISDHAGSGIDPKPAWNRYEEMVNQIGSKALTMEQEANATMWKLAEQATQEQHNGPTETNQAADR